MPTETFPGRATPMTDQEALQIIIKTTELRLSAPYQAAEALRRAWGAEALANRDQNSTEHGAVRLLIGTWERIAMFTEEFNGAQRRRFFKCHPVSLVWLALAPAVKVLRASGSVGPRFAAQFEELARYYQQWTATQEGEEYRTEAQQTVCALFA
jgi:hypothetical protein